jgi:hypothetical protein
VAPMASHLSFPARPTSGLRLTFPVSWFNPDLWWMWHVHQRVLWPCLFKSPSYRSLRAGVNEGKTIHAEHVAMIRDLVPSERLLEWKIEDGWAPLCKFLGKYIPEDTPFPCANDARGFKKRVEADLDGLGLKAMINFGILVSIICGVLARIWQKHG